MRIPTQKLSQRPGSLLSWRSRSQASGGFTLIETLVVLVMASMLIAGAMGALLSLDLCSRRSADYVAALSVVEAKLEDVRAATYKPPNGNFALSTTYLTNSDSIALNQAGATFLVAGTLITKLEPVAAGHLITVTGTFQEPRKTLTISLQTLVNQYSGGYQ
jgi:prepilin-type N-terminal cleavage/methylation domain-containing protein